MKRKKFILTVLVFLIKAATFYGQQDPEISALEEVLFPINTEVEKSVVLLEFNYKNEQFVVIGRKHQPQTDDSDKIEAFLRDLRNSKDISIMPSLIELQKRFEENFLNEWEKAYRVGHYMFEFQYEILMNMEMSLTSLYLEDFNSSQEKYDYLKNIYMLQWGDRDEKRKEKIRFFSNYINEQWNGGCIASSFCSPTLIIEKAGDLEDGILNDLSGFDPDSLTGMYIKSYYLAILGNAAIHLISDGVEEIYINRINEFDAIIPDTFFYGRNTWIFEVIGRRGRIRGINFLLDELEGEDILKLPIFKLGRLCYTGVGKQVLEKRLFHEIQNSRGEKQGEYITLLLKMLYNEYKNQPEKIIPLYNIVDKENKKLLDKLKDDIGAPKK